MDGWQALRRDPRATSGAAGLRVVAFTAHAMVGDRERALAGGFDGYLSKPIDFATFADSVAGLPAMRRERPLILAVDDEPANLALLQQAAHAPGLRRRRGGRWPVGARGRRGAPARPRLPRRDDAGARRHRGLPAAAPPARARRPADPAAHGARTAPRTRRAAWRRARTTSCRSRSTRPSCRRGCGRCCGRRRCRTGSPTCSAGTSARASPPRRSVTRSRSRWVAIAAMSRRCSPTCAGYTALAAEHAARGRRSTCSTAT